MLCDRIHMSLPERLRGCASHSLKIPTRGMCHLTRARWLRLFYDSAPHLPDSLFLSELRASKNLIVDAKMGTAATPYYIVGGDGWLHWDQCRRLAILRQLQTHACYVKPYISLPNRSLCIPRLAPRWTLESCPMIVCP